jgi:secreted PhoX family phosphatase
MTAEPRDRRSLLPLRLFNEWSRESTPRELIPNKCIWKCGAACFHEAPNENRAPDSIAEVIERRLSRRTLLKSAAAAAVPLVLSSTPLGSALLGDSPLLPSSAEAAVPGTGLGFMPLALHQDDSVQVPPGYSTQVLLRWGDPIFPTTPRMTVDNVSPALQRQTFGYNCDLNLYFERGDSRGLLWVNHEYTEGARMFRTYSPETVTKDQVDVELAAHGGTLVELMHLGNVWSVDRSSNLNRRVTGETPIELTGPARGSKFTRTSGDPQGTTVVGMLNNCAGGKTLWGTVLTAEENFHQYFANNDLVTDAAQKTLNTRYGVPAKASERRWEAIYSRFDVAKEPNEINRFGYMVEVDPTDPSSTPKKRTALGRFKHEAGSMGLSDDNRVVVYSGDDERFEYVYKFVSSKQYVEARGKANGALLDDGILYVARFNDDGTGDWLPLEPGVGALAGWTAADVAVRTRQAADLVKPTPMDRPEDIEINPINNRVYLAMTNNTSRKPEQIDGANPRPNNAAGHVLELDEAGGDLGATEFTWDVFILCGKPSDPTTYFAGYDKTQVSAIGAPDNVAFDAVGNLWIATDGQSRPIGMNDSVFAVPTAGPDRGKLQAFLNTPKGSEVCGPEFTPDYRALFVGIQHPGEEGKGPSDPQSLWPDLTWPALPSVVVVTKQGGGRIGT